MGVHTLYCTDGCFTKRSYWIHLHKRKVQSLWASYIMQPYFVWNLNSISKMAGNWRWGRSSIYVRVEEGGKVASLTQADDIYMVLIYILQYTTVPGISSVIFIIFWIYRRNNKLQKFINLWVIYILFLRLYSTLRKESQH